MNKNDTKHKSRRTAKGQPKPLSKPFSKALKNMSKHVTRTDKEKFVQKYGSSLSTISRYLNGKVADNSLAAKMYKHFTNCIQKREQILL